MAHMAVRAARRDRTKRRDPGPTPDRILGAARSEFAARGFAGARIGRIARHARCNRAMLYYYFGSKRELYEETLVRADSVGEAIWDAEDPVVSLLEWFRAAVRDPRRVRLLQWETLEGEVLRPDAYSQPSPAFASLVRLFGPDADARHKALLVVSAALLPIALPRLTEQLVGHSLSEAAFESAHARWIKALIELLSQYQSAQPTTSAHGRS